MFSPGLLATTFPTNLFIQRSFCLTPASLQCSLSITNWKPPLPNLNIRGCFPPECHHIAVCAVNSTLCVKSVNWPFNLISIFIYSCCSKWFALVKTPWGPPSVALHTSSTCSRGCDSFDIIFPLLMDVRSEKKKKKKIQRKRQRKSDSTWFSQGKRQGQTAEFEINQKLALSTGATFRLWLRFDLGSSFQWVLTSQSCEESRAGSLQRGFQWYSIYKARGSGSAATDGTVHGAFNYFSQHSWK